MTSYSTWFIFCIALSFQLSAQTDWVLEKDKNEVKVYTCDMPGSSLKAYKGITIVESNVESLVKTLQDVSNFEEWMPDIAEAELKTLDNNIQVHYLVNSAPFPVSDRDCYYQFTYQYEGENVNVTMQALPEYGPEESRNVRIPYAKGFWLFEKITDKTTRITYQAHADPGGSIPSWLANSAVVDTPFETLSNLKEYVKEL